VHLGTWREDYSVIFPAVMVVPDYYEEICSSAVEYRFTVAAFDDHGRYTTAVASIIPGRRNSALRTEPL